MKMTVLDLLLAIQRGADASIGFRYSCRVGMCGTCTLRVDGRTVLACQEPVPAGDELRLDPMAGLPVVRDLVVDTAPFWAEWARVTPYLVPIAGLDGNKVTVEFTGNPRRLEVNLGQTYQIPFKMTYSFVDTVRPDEYVFAELYIVADEKDVVYYKRIPESGYFDNPKNWFDDSASGEVTGSVSLGAPSYDPAMPVQKIEVLAVMYRSPRFHGRHESHASPGSHYVPGHGLKPPSAREWGGAPPGSPLREAARVSQASCSGPVRRAIEIEDQARQRRMDEDRPAAGPRQPCRQPAGKAERAGVPSHVLVHERRLQPEIGPGRRQPVRGMLAYEHDAGAGRSALRLRASVGQPALDDARPGQLLGGLLAGLEGWGACRHVRKSSPRSKANSLLQGRSSCQEYSSP
jgi:hypothetical protein